MAYQIEVAIFIEAETVLSYYGSHAHIDLAEIKVSKKSSGKKWSDFIIIKLTGQESAKKNRTKKTLADTCH